MQRTTRPDDPFDPFGQFEHMQVQEKLHAWHAVRNPYMHAMLCLIVEYCLRGMLLTTQ
jgi:hypothetical protein